MAHSSRIFESQPITVQNLNGFDLSHINCGTAKCGQLVPVLRKLLMQASKISVGAAVNVELPPLASPFFGRVDFCIELFFCPCAVLYGGWRQFISNQVATMFPASQDDVLTAGGYALPVIDIGQAANPSGAQIHPRTAAGSLAQTLDDTNDGLCDYLGVRINRVESSDNLAHPLYLNLLPFLAYHKIWDVFYRNASTTKTIFAVNPNINGGVSASGAGLVIPIEIDMDSPYNPDFDYGDESGSVIQTSAFKNVSLVWHSFYTSKYIYEPAEESSIESGGNASAVSSSCVFGLSLLDFVFPDLTSVLETRQRTYSRDYFVAGSVTPQQGNPATLNFTVDAQGDGEISVHGLRAIVALQRFEEKLNYDPSYRGIMRNLIGSSPSDALLEEPSYIGRLVIPVYQKSVSQNNAQNIDDANSSNPFVKNGVLGATGAKGSFTGEGSFCKGYKVGCFGYLMALASIVPHAMYGYGIDREMLATEIGDFPFPDLQTVGMDATYIGEVYADGNPDDLKMTFNYLPRYSWMKYIDDSVHGELRPNKSLDMFVLQRVFNSTPQFGTDFVTIAQTDLDGVFATNVSVSNFTCWYEIYWVFKAVMPLAAFVMPTLGELKDVHMIHTTQGGSRL